MSKMRRNFTSKFNADLVLILLREEKSINELASENEIQPNLLRKWKNEFLEKASLVFDDSREEKIKEKRKEKAD